MKGAMIQQIGYHFMVAFAPKIRLDRKAGFSFATDLAQYVDLQDVVLNADRWTFSTPAGATPNSSLTVTVGDVQVQVDAIFPTDSAEWFETRVDYVLKTFGKAFAPKTILQTAAMVRGLLDIDGDARLYLSTRVMHIDPKSVDPLGRPLHLIGLRLFFPPYSTQVDDQKVTVDWHVNVKAESSIDDPGKLFLEAEAQWPFPLEWTEKNFEKVLERLKIVKDYLDGKVMAFLHNCGTKGVD